MTAFERVCDALREHGVVVRAVGDGKAVALCPAHDDHKPSLSLYPRTDGTGIKVKCHAGCDDLDVLDRVGLKVRDLFDAPRMRAAYADRNTYRYPDGRKVYRKPGKDFSQGGNRSGRALFGADRIADADTVFVVEGEKDALVIQAVGGAAVCSAMGAGKAHLADWSPCNGKNVVVVADKDVPGTRHAVDVIRCLDAPSSIRVVEAAAGKDAADHVAAGFSLDEFVPISGVELLRRTYLDRREVTA